IQRGKMTGTAGRQTAGARNAKGRPGGGLHSGSAEREGRPRTLDVRLRRGVDQPRRVDVLQLPEADLRLPQTSAHMRRRLGDLGAAVGCTGRRRTCASGRRRGTCADVWAPWAVALWISLKKS